MDYMFNPNKRYNILCSWTGRLSFNDTNIYNIIIPKNRALAYEHMSTYIGDSFILFEGGEDVNPALYNEPNTSFSWFSERRDDHEIMVYELGMELGIPMLGICRGHQFLNVMRGGTLYQDLAHDRNKSHKSLHSLDITNKEFLSLMASNPLNRVADSLKPLVIEHVVNSMHHQGIKDLASDGTVWATHEDGLIEAVGYKNGMSVQHHPEFIGHKNFLEFMYACYVCKE